MITLVCENEASKSKYYINSFDILSQSPGHFNDHQQNDVKHTATFYDAFGAYNFSMCGLVWL